MAIKEGGGDGNGGKESEDTAEKVENQRIPFYKLFTFADKLDLFFMTMGTIGAVGNGLAQPLMTIIFGKLINSFGSSDPSKVVHEVAKVCIFFFQCLGFACVHGLFYVSWFCMHACMVVRSFFFLLLFWVLISLAEHETNMI